MKFWILYGSYLAFPLALLCLYAVIKQEKVFVRIVATLGILLSLVFIWSRFLEPQLIVIDHHTIQVGFKTKVALIADTHLGIYKNADFLRRVVDDINRENVDMVLFAGDFTYEPNIGDLSKLFAPLKDCKASMYAVLGNHDVERPGPKLRGELVDTLQSLNVKILNNDIIKFPGFSLVGLGDNWGGEDNVNILGQFKKGDHVLVMLHNPDSTLKYVNDSVDLTVAGHTHGGQIRIPFVYKQFIPTTGNFDKGFTVEPKTKLFITSGLGEVGLPMRFLNPPVINILTLE